MLSMRLIDVSITLADTRMSLVALLAVYVHKIKHLAEQFVVFGFLQRSRACSEGIVKIDKK